MQSVTFKLIFQEYRQNVDRFWEYYLEYNLKSEYSENRNGRFFEKVRIFWEYTVCPIFWENKWKILRKSLNILRKKINKEFPVRKQINEQKHI